MPDNFFIRFTPPFFDLFTDTFDALPFLATGWLEKDIGFEGNLTGPAFFAAGAAFGVPVGVFCLGVSIIVNLKIRTAK